MTNMGKYCSILHRPLNTQKNITSVYLFCNLLGTLSIFFSLYCLYSNAAKRVCKRFSSIRPSMWKKNENKHNLCIYERTYESTSRYSILWYNIIIDCRVFSHTFSRITHKLIGIFCFESINRLREPKMFMMIGSFCKWSVGIY